MNQSSGSNPLRIAVIGGGISGLAAAFYVRRLAPRASIQLFEAGPRVGGVVRTERHDGYLVECGPDNFITNVPWGTELCRRLGLDDQLIGTEPGDRRVFVVRNGRLCPVPEGFMLLAPGRLWPLVTTPLLSWRGKLRLLAECLVPRRRDSEDESLQSFATRRLGREAFERLVQPLVGGIYTADAATLSLAATLPRFIEMESTHGSLIRAALRQKKVATDGSGARYGMFAALRDGMQTLTDRLAAELGSESIRLNRTVLRVEQAPAGWTVWATPTPGASPSAPEPAYPGADALSESFDRLIVATSATHAARLLRKVDVALADDLSAIRYAGSVVVALGFRETQFARPLSGFGVVVPEIERREALSISFTSRKYPARAPDGSVLLRVFFGGASRNDQLNWSDERLIDAACSEVARLLSVQGAPQLAEVIRWQGHMPQYFVGHLDRVARIERAVARLPGLALCGSAYRGVGIPHCIHSAEQAAQRIVVVEECVQE